MVNALLTQDLLKQDFQKSESVERERGVPASRAINDRIWLSPV